MSIRGYTWAVAAFGALITALAYWPGFMSTDSFVQLAQARRGAFTDWHPPIMALLWAGLDRLVPGPALMLLLQATLFWFSMPFLLRALVRDERQVLFLLPFLGFMPAIFANIGTIWKDVQLLCWLMVSAALLFARTPRGLWLAGLASTIACAFRHNAAPAVVPLAFVALWQTPWLSNWSISKRFVACAAMALGLTAAQFAVGQVLFNKIAHAQKVYIAESLFIFDLIGIASHGRVEAIADWRRAAGRELPSDAQLLASYDPTTCSPIFAFVPPIMSGTAEGTALTRDIWARAVLRYPLAYLRHRGAGALRMWGVRSVAYPFHVGVMPNDLGVVQWSNPVSDVVHGVIERLRNTLFFRTWFWVLAAAVVLAASWRRLARDTRLYALALFSSGLFYGIPQLFVVTGSDFRYLLWTVFTSWVVCLTALTTLAYRSSK